MINTQRDSILKVAIKSENAATMLRELMTVMQTRMDGKALIEELNALLLEVTRDPAS